MENSINGILINLGWSFKIILINKKGPRISIWPNCWLQEFRRYNQNGIRKISKYWFRLKSQARKANKRKKANDNWWMDCRRNFMGNFTRYHLLSHKITYSRQSLLRDCKSIGISCKGLRSNILWNFLVRRNWFNLL